MSATLHTPIRYRSSNRVGFRVLEPTIRASAALLVFGPTLSAFSGPAAIMLGVGSALALLAVSMSSGNVISTTNLFAAAFYSAYLMLGAILGGLSFDTATLTTELRWLPPVIACLALGMLNGSCATTFILATRKATAWAVCLTLLSVPLYDEGLRSGAELWGFSSSHHIPGISAGGCLVLFATTRRIKKLQIREVAVVAPIATLVLLLSQSRASIAAVAILGVVAALREALRRSEWHKVVLTLALVVLVVTLNPRMRSTVTWLVDAETRAVIGKAYSGEIPAGTLSSAEHNIVDRFHLFGAAMRDFQNHWILGIGPGRFNDRASMPSGTFASAPWPPGPTELVPIRSEMTAHNIYLQVAVEAGVFGLLILAALTWSWTFGRDASLVGRFIVLQGLTSGTLISIAATTPWIAVALLLPRAERRATLIETGMDPESDGA